MCYDKNMKGIRKIFRSFGYSLKGIHHAYRRDKSFRMEVNWGLPVYVVLAWFLFPFQSWEIILFTFSYLIILMVELINTSFELMLDKLHPEQHEMIGRSKDISSAAVLLAFLFAFLVVCVLFYARLPHPEPVTMTHTFA